MSVNSSLELALYCYFNMTTINKSDLILSYLIFDEMIMNDDVRFVLDYQHVLLIHIKKHQN
jgi:hypothetical protein